MFSSMSCMSRTHSFLRSFKMAGVRGKNQSVQTSVCHLVFCQTEPVSWLWNSVMFDSNKPDCHRGHWYSPGKLREMHRIVISLCLALGLQLNVECQCFFCFVCVCMRRLQRIHRVHGRLNLVLRPWSTSSTLPFTQMSSLWFKVGDVVNV